MLRNQLIRDGLPTGRPRIRRLMRRMGIHAIYRKPSMTSVNNPAHKIYLYLLRQLPIQPNQVWALDTSYIPMAQGFVEAVKNQGCKISMDGRGAWRDNVMIERLWRSVKYERVYLTAYDTVAEAKTDIAQYFELYNQEREHSKINKQTPDEAYQTCLSLQVAA